MTVLLSNVLEYAIFVHLTGYGHVLNGGGGLRKTLFKKIHINSEKKRMQIVISGIDRTRKGKNNLKLQKK